MRLQGLAALVDGDRLGERRLAAELVVMAGDLQANWQHALNKTARPVGPRVNLTFRRLEALSRQVADSAAAR